MLFAAEPDIASLMLALKEHHYPARSLNDLERLWIKQDSRNTGWAAVLNGVVVELGRSRSIAGLIGLEMLFPPRRHSRRAFLAGRRVNSLARNSVEELPVS